VQSTLQSTSLSSLRKGQEMAVRINSIGSGLETQDLKAILSCSNLTSIVIPKVQSENDIHFVSKMIDSFPGLTDERYYLFLNYTFEFFFGLL
jgi:citrate lyase beta subunit